MNQTNNIPEEIKEYDGTNYYYEITEREYEELKNIHNLYKNLINKRKDALSSMIKLILENTYLYINNSESDLGDDIYKVLLKKDYYKDLRFTLIGSQKFEDAVLNNTKVRDFIIELIRTRLLRRFSNKSLNPNEKTITKQFRLSNEDTHLFSILLGSKALSQPDYISALIRYFLVSKNRLEILYYKRNVQIERAITNKEYLFLSGKKIKPVKIVYGISQLKELLYFDASDKTFNSIKIYSLTFDVEQLPLKYSLSSIESQILNAFERLDTITVEYDIVPSIEKKEYNSINDNHVIKRIKKGNHVIETLEFYPQIPPAFYRDQSRGLIEKLVFSDNYNNYLNLLKDYKETD